jgi:hypothetical protein
MSLIDKVIEIDERAKERKIQEAEKKRAAQEVTEDIQP